MLGAWQVSSQSSRERAESEGGWKKGTGEKDAYCISSPAPITVFWEVG